MKTLPTTPGSRRSLFARFRGGPEQVRPPWSRTEEDFLEACSRCDDCIKSCPTGVLTKGHAGYPIVDFFRASCTLCGVCAQSCKDDCFVSLEAPAWRLKAIVGTLCVEPKGVVCRACEESCPVSAIIFKPKLGGGASAIVSAERCTGCGACVRPCPVKAISIAIPRQPEKST